MKCTINLGLVDVAKESVSWKLSKFPQMAKIVNKDRLNDVFLSRNLILLFLKELRQLISLNVT